jgi:mRNA-degrading endonuclease RelE of RelBE toxin-antitoxin system
MTVKAVYFTPTATRQWRTLSADIRRRIDAKLMTYVMRIR